jgi:hypothetical protein
MSKLNNFEKWEKLDGVGLGEIKRVLGNKIS